jgi:hypothetical protein
MVLVIQYDVSVKPICVRFFTFTGRWKLNGLPKCASAQYQGDRKCLMFVSVEENQLLLQTFRLIFDLL